MKQVIVDALKQAVIKIQQDGGLPGFDENSISVERARDLSHGDFASNIAMKLCKLGQVKPRDLALKIVNHLPQSDAIASVDIAGPGFINFTLRQDAYLPLIAQIREQGDEFGDINLGCGARVICEFVSTNPTGPLHVGHGRGAAYGDALARLLKKAGYDTHSEYYINDAGRQMDILAVSVLLRYWQQAGLNSAELGQVEWAHKFPENAYQGEYIKDIATQLQHTHGDLFFQNSAGNSAGNSADFLTALLADLPTDIEQSMDVLITRCRTQLGDENYRVVFDAACAASVADIRQDLQEFGVGFDEWFSERSLVSNGDIARAIDTLEKNGFMYEKKGAKWFRSSEFGDEKDRVVTRANGANTYFASDIAYHYHKAARGFDRIINIFGADHHGYIKRIQAAFEALGCDAQKLKFLLVQFAILYRGKERVSMSTRGGQFVTLRELREEVGNDACRFFYVLRKPDQHLDFDLELAKSESQENPVYYIQYAHARICSIFRQLKAKELDTPDSVAPDYRLLTEARELELLRTLSRFPEVIEFAAIGYEPHQIAYYLRELANDFHGYYNAHPFLSSENDIRLARLGLIDATRIVIANGLKILGVSAPQKM